MNYYKLSLTFKVVKDAELNKLKAEFFVPQANDGVFNKIRFLELEQEQATKLVENYNEENKKFLKADVVDLTDSDRRVTPTRKRSPGREGSRDSRRRRRSRTRSRSRDRRRSPRDRRSPPRRRRRSYSPEDRNSSRDRPRGHKGGWNSPPPKRSDSGWAKESDKYGFGGSNGRDNDDMAKYGFAEPRASGNGYGLRSRDGGGSRDYTPSIARGRLPNGLIFTKAVNEASIRALEAFCAQGNRDPPRQSNYRDSSRDRAPRSPERRDPPRDNYGRRDDYGRDNYREPPRNPVENRPSYNPDPRERDSRPTDRYSHPSPANNRYSDPPPSNRDSYDQYTNSRNDVRSDPRSDPRNDPRGPPRDDPRSDPRNQDPRNDPRNERPDSRSDPRSDYRNDPRRPPESRSYPPGPPPADNSER